MNGARPSHSSSVTDQSPSTSNRRAATAKARNAPCPAEFHGAHSGHARSQNIGERNDGAASRWDISVVPIARVIVVPPSAGSCSPRSVKNRV
jgi:hypothetical protein